MSDLIIILDTETTGQDPETCALVELAWATYHLDHGLVDARSILVDPGAGAEVPDVVGIDAGMAHEYGTTAWVAVLEMDRDALNGEGALAYVAHNAGFDARVIERHQPDEAEGSESMRRWVCTYRDIEWPLGNRSLNETAISHGVGVVSAHRALDDVMTLVRLHDAVRGMGHDLRAMYARAMAPRVRCVARVSYDDRQQAKDAGFTWDGERREWWRAVIADEVDAFVEALPFRCHVAR